MRPLPFVLLLAASACAPLTTTPPDSGGGRDDDDAAPLENPWSTDEQCPTFASGTVSMTAGGVARTLEVELPADPAGAPVVFAWHWLGGTATWILDWMGVRDLADEGFIVVAPESSGLPFEWDVEDPGDTNVDLALFDAVLPCLWDQFEIDADAVYATGMSAGGLMTTFLTMHRAADLAATAPFSGGTPAQLYARPAEPIPVLVTWGGPSDTYGGFDFHGASLTFLDLLTDDGHVAVACEHDAGHLPPVEATDMLVTFFGDHRRGLVALWPEGLPADLPEWCTWP